MIVPAPSHESKNIERGFNHVVEMFRCLDMKILDMFSKNKDVSQHNLSYIERQKIKDIIYLKNNANIENKKILLVDDILTTGATLKACINLLRPLKPKEIRILVLSKRKFDSSKLKNSNEKPSKISYFQRIMNFKGKNNKIKN